MVIHYWSVDTLFWQVSVDHNMDVQYQRCTLYTKAACLGRPISCSIAGHRVTRLCAYTPTSNTATHLL